MLGPVVISVVGLSERLFDAARILALLDVVKPIGKSIQVLSFDYNVYMV